MDKRFFVRFYAAGSDRRGRQLVIDYRSYGTLGRAMRGIEQGLNPQPPGRGHAGASLFAFMDEREDILLGDADWGDGVYWLDLTPDGLAAGLRYPPDEETGEPDPRNPEGP